jgi:hypothetical protein
MSDVIKKLENYGCHFAPTRSTLISIYKAMPLTVTDMSCFACSPTDALVSCLQIYFGAVTLSLIV